MGSEIRIPRIDSIRFDEICFGHEGQYALLRNVTFDFPVDTVCWIKSPEGEGKSTLLQILACLQFPQHGSYFLNDLNVSEMSFEEFLPYRLTIGYTFDYGGLLSNRTLRENLLLPLLYHKIVPEADARQRVDHVLTRFSLLKFANERPAHVPGRVRKLVCLLRALVIHPQMLLLDDPSVGLGQETAEEFVEFVHELRKDGIARHVFVASYDENFVSKFEHQIIHIDEGQLWLQKTGGEKKAVNL
ncbi:MAG: ATP-binding cassette domain-containing protein [Bdellovibrionaceae bacterium]|nr:ATP-binding cassette domain-containing protein [Pseudobdellovibrionaceae bacterium]